MEQNYITILIQSLDKKLKVLEEISRENKNQKRILKEEELDEEAFEAVVDRKAQLIEQIDFLDEGFDTMYQRVKELLQGQSQKYHQEITALKKLIGQITEKTVMIQREELENRNLAEMQFMNSKKKIRLAKNSKDVASKYYTSMAKQNYVEPQFMDKKK